MKTSGTDLLRSVTFGLILAVLSASIGWLCFRTTIIQALPPGEPLVQSLVGHEPDIVLSRAMMELTRQRGILDPATLAAVGKAAQSAPLDARPYVILGHQALLERRNRDATEIFEAGQRLNPRHRLLHVLLLDRYLRTGRFSDAAGQFSILSRLIGSVQAPIAQALADMSVAPETRDAVRRTLQLDPQLELGVLMALARSKVDAKTVFELATPAAMAVAPRADSWGPALVNRLVEQGEFSNARRIWALIYRVSDTQTSSGVYNPEFKQTAATPPFNWSLTANATGVAELRSGKLAVEYYGRDTGQLATQILLLAPGSYRMRFMQGGSPGAGGTTLSWSVSCIDAASTALLNLTLPPVAARPRRITSTFAVPVGCRAQRLVLNGNAGEFPAPINATLERFSIRKVSSRS